MFLNCLHNSIESCSVTWMDRITAATRRYLPRASVFVLEGEKGPVVRQSFSVIIREVKQGDLWIQ